MVNQLGWLNLRVQPFSNRAFFPEPPRQGLIDNRNTLRAFVAVGRFKQSPFGQANAQRF